MFWGVGDPTYPLKFNFRFSVCIIYSTPKIGYNFESKKNLIKNHDFARKIKILIFLIFRNLKSLIFVSFFLNFFSIF